MFLSWTQQPRPAVVLNCRVAREFDSNEKLQIIRTFTLKTDKKGIHAPLGPVQHNQVVTICVSLCVCVTAVVERDTHLHAAMVSELLQQPPTICAGGVCRPLCCWASAVCLFSSGRLHGTRGRLSTRKNKRITGEHLIRAAAGRTYYWCTCRTFLRPSFLPRVFGHSTAFRPGLANEKRKKKKNEQITLWRRETIGHVLRVAMDSGNTRWRHFFGVTVGATVYLSSIKSTNGSSENDKINETTEAFSLQLFLLFFFSFHREGGKEK